jgi:hypothetical protein
VRSPQRDRSEIWRTPAMARAVILALGVVMALLAAPARSSAEVPIPSFPPIPPIHVHLPKPQEKATFNVVVEGQSRSTRTGDITGPTGGCITTVQGTVTDKTRYLRGRGVHLEADRYGKEVVIHRVGRETDTSMALVAAQTRTAEGKGYAESANIPNVPCTLTTEPLGQDECGEPQDLRIAASLEYDAGIMKMKINSKSVRAINQCGDTEHFGSAIASFEHAFPSPPPLVGDRLSLAQIFGHAHALKLHFVSGFANNEVQTSTPAPPPFTGGTKEKAFNEATVRLIRIKNG